MKFFAPNHTQTPNDLFDHWLPHLSESELKVLLVIFRKTFGWHKVRDKISISQLMTLTGLGRDAVINAGKTLHQKGIILREVLGSIGRQETYFELVIEENSNNSDQSEFQTPPSRNSRPPPVGNSDPQNKIAKETYAKETTTPTPSFDESQKPKSDSVVVFSFLQDIGLNADQQLELTKEYANDELSLAHGVKYATHPETKIKTTLIQAIRWASKNKPDLQKTPTEKIAENKKLALKIRSMAYIPPEKSFEIFNQYIEISHRGGASGCYKPTTINYSDNGFEEQLKNALNKMGILKKKE